MAARVYANAILHPGKRNCDQPNIWAPPTPMLTTPTANIQAAAAPIGLVRPVASLRKTGLLVAKALDEKSAIYAHMRLVSR